MSKLDDSDMQPHWKAELGRDSRNNARRISGYGVNTFIRTKICDDIGGVRSSWKREFPPSRCVPMQWVELAGLGGAEQ
jgi:hypothetical protein